MTGDDSVPLETGNVQRIFPRWPIESAANSPPTAPIESPFSESTDTNSILSFGSSAGEDADRPQPVQVPMCRSQISFPVVMLTRLAVAPSSRK